MATNSTVVFVLIGVSLFILSPIVIYRMLEFKKLMELQMIQKRYPKLLLVSGCFMTAWIILGFPLSCLDLSDMWSTDSQRLIVDRIAYTLIIFVTVGLLMTIWWRFWHMFYDLMHQSLQQNNWKKELDPELDIDRDELDNNVNANETPFYLKHGATYGSKQWLKNKVIALYFVCVFVIIFVYQLTIGTANIIMAHLVSCGIQTVIVMAALRLAFIIPPFEDRYFVRHEMKLVLYQLLVATVVATACCIAFFVTSDMWYMTALFTVGTLLVAGVSMVAFWWIPKRVVTAEDGLKEFQETAEKKKEKEKEKETAADGIDTDDTKKETSAAAGTGTGTGTTARRGSLIVAPEPDAMKDIARRVSMSQQERRASLLLPAPMNDTEKAKSYELADILFDDETFAQFRSNLAKDFSTEYLLCFVEIMQFKFLMKERFDIINPDALKGTDIEFDIEYPFKGVAPLSEINKKGFNPLLGAYKANDDPEALMKESKDVCFQIFTKYIRTGAPFKIKILPLTKEVLDVTFQNEAYLIALNMSPEQLFSVYDEAVAEVWSVMNAFPAFQTACDNLK